MTRRTVTLLLASLPLLGGDWSDTFLGYRYGTQFREPAIDGTVEKHILQLGHASGWAYGTHFFNVDLLMSDAKDPANQGTTGASEVYVVYRGALSLGRLSGKDLGFGPVRDVSLTAGFDFNAKNTAFAPKKRLLVLGPTFHFRVARGFLDLGLHYAHEQNYNGIVGKAVDFKGTYLVSLAWAKAFQVAGLAADWSGFLNQVGAKGRDGFGAETRPETLAETALLFRLSPKGRVRLGPGLQIWNNKFGGANHEGPAPATNRRVLAPMLEMQVHF